MSKLLRFGSYVVVALLPLPALAQTKIQYGFPITEAPARDLPCHMVTHSGNTLDLARLCGATPQTASPLSRRPASAAIPRRRLGSSGFSKQYTMLASTYPDSRVREMLTPRISYAESVCKRLDSGMSVEKIRSEDIGELKPSGNMTRDNAAKQNIEITLKAAPQYYCPEGESVPVNNLPSASAYPRPSGNSANRYTSGTRSQSINRNGFRLNCDEKSRQFGFPCTQ